MIYKTAADYRKAWEDAYRIDPPVPLNVDIELASTCNLRCPFCFIPDPKFEQFIAQKSDDGRPLRRLMPMELALRVLDEAIRIGVPAIKFNWRGESTLHPEYTAIIKYARDFGWNCDVDLNHRPFFELLANTNANCPQESIDGLMYCTKVMVSLDSMVPETYAKMRVGGNLKKAKDTIWELVRRGHPNVWVRRVLAKMNEGEDFYGAVWKEWGNKVKVSQHYCFDRNQKQSSEISGCEHDDGLPRRYCGYPSQRLLITSAGFAYPCCLDLHETMRVGDFNNQTLLEIWNGQPMKKLRADLRANDKSRMSDACRYCESWMAYDTPQRAYVQDVQVKS